MSGFVVHALLGVVDGQTDEVSTAVETIDDALDAIRELATARPRFHAITVIHAEHHDRLLAGSDEMGPAT